MPWTVVRNKAPWPGRVVTSLRLSALLLIHILVGERVTIWSHRYRYLLKAMLWTVVRNKARGLGEWSLH